MTTLQKLDFQRDVIRATSRLALSKADGTETFTYTTAGGLLAKNASGHEIIKADGSGFVAKDGSNNELLNVTAISLTAVAGTFTVAQGELHVDSDGLSAKNESGQEVLNTTKTEFRAANGQIVVNQENGLTAKNQSQEIILKATGDTFQAAKGKLDFGASGLHVQSDLSVDGDFVVKGNMVTVHERQLNVGDNYIYLRAGAVTNGSGGIVINNGPVNAVQAATLDLTSNPTSVSVTYASDAASAFQPNMLVQITSTDEPSAPSAPSADGIYMIKDVTNPVDDSTTNVTITLFTHTGLNTDVSDWLTYVPFVADPSKINGGNAFTTAVNMHQVNVSLLQLQGGTQSLGTGTTYEEIKASMQSEMDFVSYNLDNTGDALNSATAFEDSIMVTTPWIHVIAEESSAAVETRYMQLKSKPFSEGQVVKFINDSEATIEVYPSNATDTTGGALFTIEPRRQSAFVRFGTKWYVTP